MKGIKFDQEELNACVARLRSGDKTAVNECILRLVPITMTLLKSIQDDDVRSDIWLELVVKVNKAPTDLTDDNIKKFVMPRLIGQLKDSIKKWREGVVRVPRKTRGKRQHNDIDNFIEWRDDIGNLIAKEFLAKLIKSPEERRIVEWRLEGFTFMEIAKKVGCSDAQVIRILNKIKERIIHEYAKLGREV